ncbi:MAG: InlB B-repeat-containing protein [Bacteroidales bacterium]|nr:InlB B-repeat-containing protein [Bacteroidales bacterium]
MKKIAFPTMLCLMLAVFINSCEPFIEPPKHFSVVFHANGGKGSMKMQIMNMGNEESLKLSPNTFTRDGYVFTGWNTEATGKGRVFKDRQIISSHENLSLYAQWKSAGSSGGGGSTSGTESGHKWVDLGLPSGLKWATCNVGASTPEGYGSYFAWGETSPKDNYEWSTYKYNGSSILTKYNTKSSLGTVDNKTTLELSDDAARANWGGNWRMPTQAEQDELIKNCTWTWVILDGVSGYKVVSKTNANSIFLPAAGYKVGSYVSGFGSYGYYWSSSLYESNPIYACFLSSYSSGVNWNGYYRYEGRSVRAVYGDNTAAQTFTLTFNANGGSGTMAAQTFEAGVSQALAANAFTRSGYTFTGWNTNADGSGTSYTDKQSITLSQNITLYAQWKKVAYGNVEYAQVDVNAAGIVDGGSELSAGTVLAETPSIVMTVGAYDTYRTATAAANGMTKVRIGSSVLDLAVACQGTTNPKDAAAGNCDANATVPASGAFFTFDVKKNGYLYVVIKASSNKTYLVGEDGTLIGYDFAMHTPNAPWGPILRYTLEGEGEFNNVTDPSLLIWPERIALGEGWEAAAGGAGKIAASGVAVIKFPVFAWCRYTVNACGTRIMASGYFFGTSEETVVLDDGYGNEVVLYETGVSNTNYYNVTFNANGGSGTMAAQTFEAGVSQAIAANAFTRSGYTFTGWNTKADGSGNSYTDGQEIALSQDITLYAQWKKDIVNYTITFNANGGTGTMAAQTFEAGVSQAIAANAFTRSSYTFTGWNTNADGSGTSYTDGQEITLTQDITLYAQWNQEQVVSGTENGHDYVDLGLPSGTKWAICNLGATAPEGYGDYFAWGEIAPKDDFSWETYKYCNGSETSLTKYCDNSSYGYNGFTDNKTILDLSDDAARANWGGKWRIPTKAEQDELRNNCTWTLTTQNGVNGYKVTSKTNGNSIFLPAAGTRIGTSVSGVGSYGYYWSSSLKESAPDYAYDFSFTSFNVGCYISGRYVGRTVRAVFSDNDKPSTFVTLTFNANGGSGTMAAQTFEAGVSQAITANSFKRSGYTFTGWNTAANGSGTAYTDKQSITLTQDITLYAQWNQEQVVSGTENGHDYVDLGLPSGLKWATCNVGATTPEAYGDYFAWGETTPKDNYDWSTYKYCNGSSSTLTKYNTKSSFGTVDNKTTLDLSDDAARANWGGTWRMPTRAEQYELRYKCIWTWTTQNGVNGYKVTSKTNGNSIFLPAAGGRDGTSVNGVGSFGICWSSSLDESYPYLASGLRFYSGSVDLGYIGHCYGYTVRAVCP